jgi:hypothetical protein
MTTEPDNTEFSILEDQIRECLGRVVYNRRAHEKVANLVVTKCANREARIHGVMESTVDMYGDLQGIVGGFDELDLPPLDGPVEGAQVADQSWMEIGVSWAGRVPRLHTTMRFLMDSLIN